MVDHLHGKVELALSGIDWRSLPTTIDLEEAPENRR
jgi:hypothetical protein